MKLSSDRILTTHVGSLPRPPAVVDYLLRRERGQPFDQEGFERTMKKGVADIVSHQAEMGIAVVSDGETSKIGYSTYLHDRYSGFGGEVRGKVHLDLRDHPEFINRMQVFTGPRTYKRMQCIAPIELKDGTLLENDIANFRAALSSTAVTEGFMNAASPGVVAAFLPNACYSSHADYIEALARALQLEYEAIAGAGLVLQIDCPDLAMARHTSFQELTEEQFLARAAFHVEALNYALRNVPVDQVRVHICWGNYEGPHDHDIALEKILPIALKLKARALLFESANPRHEHEWAVWRDARLPEDLVLVPGVLDSCSNYVEHPELVAQRLLRFADIVGRERVMAGTDCGFGTFAGYSKVDGGIAFKKLRAMVEGAALASQRLWH
jgi:5-methyltetrahydropteroyltriglutamate--homocysteine methyltransferase